MSTLKRRLALGFALGSIVIFLVCAVGGTILDASNRAGERSTIQTIGIFLGFGGFVAAGALILWKRPDNLIGWLLCYCGTTAMVTFAAGEYAIYGTLTEPGSLPAVTAVAWFQSWSWLPAMALSLVFLPLYFPHGKLPSRRWRPVAITAALVIAAIAMPLMFGPDIDMEVPEGTPTLENPLAINLGRAWDIMEGVSFFALALLLVLVLASLISRFRRAEADERHQLKWLIYSVCLLLASAVIEPLLPDVSGYMFVFALVCVAGAIAIAVLKYRLYEIDVIINRTLVYVPLTAIVIGLYTALVGVFKTLVTEFTEANTDAAVAVTTLLVVVILTPLKNQLQVLVDRYFKDPHDALRSVRTLTGQAQSVVRVLETERFAQAFLDEAVGGLDATGGLVEFVAGGEQRVVRAREAWSSAIELPLRHRDEDVGRLAIGPNRRGRPYDEVTVKSLEESAAVLAAVISVGAVPATRSVTEEGSVTEVEAMEPEPARSST